MNAEPIAAEFLQHSEEELDHAGRIAARIRQFGGSPDFNSATLGERSHSEYVEAASLRDMVIENLVATASRSPTPPSWSGSAPLIRPRAGCSRTSSRSRRSGPRTWCPARRAARRADDRVIAAALRSGALRPFDRRPHG